MTDTIFNPKHYMQGSHECIDEIKAMLTPDEFKGFLKGNIIKYRYRANLKNGKEDLAKADNYAYYLMHGTFKKADAFDNEPVEKKNDSNDSNSPADNPDDPLRHLIDDDNVALFRAPEDKAFISFLKENHLDFNFKELSKQIEKLDKGCVEWIDTYKGQKISAVKDQLSFNLFDNMRKFCPIASIVYTMHRQHDLAKDTPVTFAIIVDCVKDHKVNYLENDINQHIFTFNDNSKLSIKVDRGISDRHVLTPRRHERWYEVELV